MISADPARIGPHPKDEKDSIPCLTSEQANALSILQDVAAKHHAPLQTQPGDIVYLNNLGLMHAREAYEDGASSSRHLVRLWLRNERLGWAVPPTFKRPWDAAFGKRADLITDRNYPPVPPVHYEIVKFGNGTAAFVPEDDDDDEDDNEDDVDA